MSGAERPADPPDLEAELTTGFLHGLDCFDAGDWHEAHEQIEEVWSGEVGARRHLLQALIQLAVALHHRAHGNFGGALSLLERAREHAAAVAAPTCFLAPRELQAQLAALERELLTERERPEPRFDPALLPRFDAVRARVRAERLRRGLAPVPGA